jgi:hypothetical protein
MKQIITSEQIGDINYVNVDRVYTNEEYRKKYGFRIMDSEEFTPMLESVPEEYLEDLLLGKCSIHLSIKNGDPDTDEHWSLSSTGVGEKWVRKLLAKKSIEEILK